MVVWLVLIYKKGLVVSGDEDTLISTGIYDNEGSANKACDQANGYNGIYAIYEQHNVMTKFVPDSFIREFITWNDGER